LRISSVFTRSAVLVGAALALAGCGGAGLDYGTQSISTTACQGFTPALVSPASGDQTVSTTISSVEMSVSPSTSGPAETPSGYQLIIENASTGAEVAAVTLAATSPPSGAPANTTYLMGTLSVTLTANTEYDVSLYNTASTCENKSFASFKTGSS